MKELNAKIRTTKFMMAIVIIIGLLAAFVIIKPVITEAMYRKENGIHLDGEVYTARSFNVAIQPATLFYDRWDGSTGYQIDYEGDFVSGKDNFKHGMGMYIPSETIEVGEIGTTQLGYWLGKEFDEVYFKVGADTNWTSGYEGGEYRIICYVNGIIVRDTDFNDYTYSKEIKVDVSSADYFVVELQQRRGNGDTLKIILGEFQINKLAEQEDA